MLARIISIFLTFILLSSSVVQVSAFETDQFNLSPEPLADIGDEVTDYVAAQVADVAADLNDRIGLAERCLAEKSVGCESKQKSQRSLAYLRSERAVAKEVYDRLSGGNLMTTKFGKWMHRHKFRAQPASYKAPYRESIYIIKPTNYVTLSPTIRMYGHEFGIDKLEHLFQQGHQYYEKVQGDLENGTPREEAVKNAIEWGKRTERTYYGFLTSGVYSNADLNANYVGLRFYEGLTRPIVIGDSARPAILVAKDGRWVLSDKDSLKQHVLKPFLGEHLNEAHNPSAYRLTLAGSVRRAVKRNSCGDWSRRFPALTAPDLVNGSRAIELWHGEDYGFTKRSGSVSLADLCFPSSEPDRSISVAAFIRVLDNADRVAEWIG